MSEGELNIILGLLFALHVLQSVLIARLLYKDRKSDRIIKTQKIEMEGFVIGVENQELKVKPKE